MPDQPYSASVRLRRLGWVFASVLVAHAALTVGLIVLAYTMSMSRFDSGGDATFLEQVAQAMLAVVSFPLLVVFGHHRASAAWFPGLLGYVPVVATSAVWAGGACYLLHAIRSRRRKGSYDGR